MIIDCNKPEGNSFVIIASVGSLLKEVGRGDEVEAVCAEMMSGSYEELKEIATRVTNGTFEFIN